MSQPSEVSELGIETPFGYSIFKEPTSLEYFNLEWTFALTLPTTKILITSGQGNRYNKDRRNAIELKKYRLLLSYDDDTSSTPEPGKFSQVELFRAMVSNILCRSQNGQLIESQSIMAEQLVHAEQRLNELEKKKVEWLDEDDFTRRKLPLEPEATEIKMMKEVVVHGYRKAVTNLINPDRETGEDLTRFKISADFPPATLERLLQYTFAHCVSRQCLQLHHPDNDLR